ncbi:MAG: TlpA family protein disulfide reductase [Thermoguttaceae bacterium]|nr:TlpA family protein disulfide reductase [Thermoguttaceae bacterium]
MKRTTTTNEKRAILKKSKTARVGLAGLLLAAAFGGASACGDEPEKAAADDGGVCVVGPNGEIVCGDEAVAVLNAGNASVASNGSGRKIDLTKTPWLVESVNLPDNHPALLRDRIVWADSYLWCAIEEVVGGAIPVEQWVNKAPKPEDLAGKYVLVEMWATWCPPCRRSLPYLDFISKKYKDDLVVVSICETDEEAIRNMPSGRLDPDKVEYFVAVDTGRRLANKLGVRGIPHAILLEPSVGGVVWEGTPTAPRYELDDKTLEKIFKIGRKMKNDGLLPEASPVKFAVSEPTDEERASRRNVDAKDVKDVPGEPSVDAK